MLNKNIILKPKQKNTKDVYHLYEIRVKKINLRLGLILKVLLELNPPLMQLKQLNSMPNYAKT